MKIRIFGDWEQDCFQMLDVLSQYTEGLVGSRYGRIEFVNDDSYEMACVFNFPTEELLTPSGMNFGMLLEPPEILARMYPQWVNASCIPGVDHYWAFCTGTNFPEALGMGFATCPPLVNDVNERSRACMIASNKLFTPWHSKRHEVVAALKKSDLNIDFYGRGSGLDPNDQRIRGEIPPGQKQGVLRQYEYVIDFENSPHGVVTDKLFDALLCGAVPITNAKIVPTLLGDSGFRLVDFDAPVRTIVDQIRGYVSAAPTPEDYLSVKEASRSITSGRMNIVKWIHDTAMDIAGR